MPPRSPRSPWRLLLRSACRALATAALCACAAAPPAGDAPLPRPDLAAMEAGARQRVLAAAERADGLRRSGAPAAERAAALGALGDLYFAYELFAPAVDCYRRAAALAPDDAQWPALLGMAQQAAGDYAGAEASLRRATTLSPDDAALELHLGAARLEAGRLEPAAASYRRALELAPDSAAAELGLGRVEAAADRPRAAIPHFERALTLAPQADALHYELGQLYRRVGDLEAARRQLARRGDREVVFPDPLRRRVALLRAETAFDVVRQLAADADRLSADDVLGFAIVQFGEASAAIRQFERVLAERESDLSPAERARARYVLGALEARQGDPGAAAASYRAALALDPTLLAARVQLGWALAQQGDPAAGLAEIEAVLAEHPDDGRALLKHAALLADTQPARARRDLERLLAARPDDAEAHLRLAQLDEAAGRFDAAGRMYEAALDLAMAPADRALVRFRLGELALRRGDGAAALDHYRAALRIDPGFHEARLRLGGQLAASGRTAAAAEEFARALAERGDDPAAVLGRASTLIALGRHAEARRVLESGLEHDPDGRVAAALARHLAACPDPAVRDGRRAVELATDLMARHPTPVNAETLAMALAQDGRYEPAAERQRELLAFARRHGLADMVPRLEGNLARYERGEACCAAP